MSEGFKGLRLYNTLTRRKADFVPIDPHNVRVYVCGPTVYDFAHIGNARPVIVFDVLFRLLRELHGADHVTYVRNITDVDDKINARAARDFPDLRLNEAIRRVTETTNAQFQSDAMALGCLEPTLQPRATEHIAEMIVMIEQLVAKGHAYAAEGHVLFDVKSWKGPDGAPEYGKLSRRPLDDMIAGARVEVAPYKRDPMDFVLWKPSSAEEPGWESPWGRGRPGWHIECSAMSWKHLGETFDIHGGGIDLTFPHHENEVAQSRCAHGTDVMANVWMHNGFLQVEGRKMAKSEGNFVTIHELLTGWNRYAWPGQVIRYAMLKTHYRQPIDFSFSLLTEAMKELSDFALNIWFDSDKWRYEDVKYILESDEFRNGEFIKALKDDLNTPKAIAELHKFSETSRQNQQLSNDKADATASNLLKAGLVLLGIDLSHEAYDPNWMQSQIEAQMETGFKDTIQKRVEQRLAFLREKNFAEADRIRADLAEKGVQLMDYKDPETGERRTRWEAKG